MGGMGSGRSSNRLSIERTECITLDVNECMRGFDGSQSITQAWPLDEDGSIQFEIRLSPVGEYAYAYARFNIEQAFGWTGDQTQHIDLEYSVPPYGGKRWWWICPRTNLKVAKLYLPNGGRQFWSRQAYRLVYDSQRETPADRAGRRAGKLYDRLGGEPNAEGYYPKPKWMRWKTYNAICNEIGVAETIAEDKFLRTVARILAR